MTPVVVHTAIRGALTGIVRSIDHARIVVALVEPPLLGSVVAIEFGAGADAIVIRGEVQRSYCHNVSSGGFRAVGLRVLEAIP